MKNNDIKMDWRHFTKVMAITFIALFGLSGIVFVRKFDGILCFNLVMLSGLLSFILAVLISGIHAIKRDWGNGRIQLVDFVVPTLVLISILGGMAILIYLVPESHQRYVGYFEIALWLVAIGFGLRSWILKRRFRAQIDSTDFARRNLRAGLLKKQ